MSDGDRSWWPSAETLSDIGHGVLDVAGLVPGLGEPADIANAAWYAAQGNYLEAGLSLISAIPFVGYAGTVGKLVKKFGVKPSKAALEALQKVDFGKVFEKFRSNPKLAPYVDKIVAALDNWRKDLLEKFSPKVTPGRCVACEKAAQVKANKLAGTSREALVRSDLTAKYPGASVQSEVYLRTANGERAIDPLTGTARRIDSVVIKDGHVLESIEVTSMNATKKAQILKENRIRNNGGTFIRDRVTRKLIDIKLVPTKIIRKP